MLHERALRLQASWEGLRGESLEQMIRQKFSYVVSCQAYGQHKKARDPKAADTEFLVQRFRNLRVAYVDKAVTFAQARNADGSPGAMRESVRFYSVSLTRTPTPTPTPTPTLPTRCSRSTRSPPPSSTAACAPSSRRAAHCRASHQARRRRSSFHRHLTIN